MGYATVADMRARFPERDLAQLTDPNGAVVDEARVQTALDDASAEIARYPAASRLSAEELRRLACDIAYYRLGAGRPLDDLKDARKRYEDAIAFLESASAATAAARVDYFADARRLSPELLEDYVP